MRRAAATIVLVTLVLSGCGSSKGKELSPQSAALLQRDLNTVQRQFNFGGGACDDIQNETFDTIDNDLKQIPDDVDSDLRSALEDSFDRLRDLTGQDCKKPEPTTTQETTPAPTTTEETTTQPPPTNTQTQPEEKPKKKNKDKGNQDTGAGPGGNLSGGVPAPGE